MCPCALGDKASVSTDFATYVTDFVFSPGICIFLYQILNDEELHCHSCVIPMAITVLMNIEYHASECPNANVINIKYGLHLFCNHAVSPVCATLIC